MALPRECWKRPKTSWREVKTGKPFFAYVPYTMVHIPVLPSPEFDGIDRKRLLGRYTSQTDAYVGELLDTVDKLGAKDNTLFIFTSNNGAEMIEQWTAWAGPWRGTYFTGLEGSLRVPSLSDGLAKSSRSGQQRNCS
jgi:arylsulfatase A-like enzyme